MKIGKLEQGAVRFAKDIPRITALDDKTLEDVLGGQPAYNCNTVCGGDPCLFYPIERCPVWA